MLPLVLLPPAPAPSAPSTEALDREENVGRRLPLTLVLPPAARPAAALPRVAPVPFIRALPAVSDERLVRAATPPALTPPRPTLAPGTPEAGGGLAVEEDEDSRDERRPTEILPPPATDFLPPAPAVLERPNPKLPPWLLLGLGGAVDAALPDARAARPPWERVGLCCKLDKPPPPPPRPERLRRADPAGLLRVSWRVALPSWTWLTWLAKRRLQTVSLADAAVGDRLTNMRAFPSPDRQSCG